MSRINSWMGSIYHSEGKQTFHLHRNSTQSGLTRKTGRTNRHSNSKWAWRCMDVLILSVSAFCLGFALVSWVLHNAMWFLCRRLSRWAWQPVCHAEILIKNSDTVKNPATLTSTIFAPVALCILKIPTKEFFYDVWFMSGSSCLFIFPVETVLFPNNDVKAEELCMFLFNRRAPVAFKR